MRKSAQCDAKFMFIPTRIGIVSATIRPPSSVARSAAASWCSTPAGLVESIVSTFQLSGRCAAADIRANRSTSSSENPLRQPSVMASTVVPGWCATSSHNASTSSGAA